MKSPTLLLGALLGAMAAPVLAQDQDRRFYLGLDAGQARIHRDYPEYSSGAGDDGESAAWKLRLGWRLSSHWSFEVGYTDFGDYDGSFPILLGAGPADEPLAIAPGDFSTSAKGFDLSAVATWPIGERFYLSTSAGLVRRELQTRYDAAIYGIPRFRGKDGDLAAQYGVGFGFSLDEAWDIGLSWLTTRNLEGDFEFLQNQSDPSMLSLGVRFRL